MIISKAPVRISFGGGGTDLPAYFREHGGAVLSTTIAKYTYAVLTDSDRQLIDIHSADYQLDYSYDARDAAGESSDALDIPRTVLRRYGAGNGLFLSLKSDVPTGSGLGLSGAVTVNMINLLRAFREQACSRAEIAQEATLVELELLGRPIGLQDQYASAFGGLNFMEFTADGTRVMPMALPDARVKELEGNCMLFFLNRQRNSATILHDVQQAVRAPGGAAVEMIHRQKETAYAMREALQSGELRRFAELLDAGWQWKRSLAATISNPHIERCYAAARAAGALGGKVTGAGGGGFLLLYAEPDAQSAVRRSLAELGLHQELNFKFDRAGVQTLLNHKDRLNASLWPEGYLLGLETIMRRVDSAAVQRIVDAIYAAHRRNKKLIFLGNGGSAATASHAICDLSKTAMVPNQRPIRAISLTDNISLLTAWSNDVSFEDAFCGQLRQWLEPGDVVIGLSGSGNSRNMVKALRYAKEHGALTIGLVGFDGGEAKKVVDLDLHVPSANYQFVEDIHMIVMHLITLVLKNKLEQNGMQMSRDERMQWPGRTSEAALRFAAASAWQAWAPTAPPGEAHGVAGLIRGEGVRRLAEARPETGGYPEAFVDAFSRVCARWSRLKRGERFTEGAALLDWRGAPAPTEATADAWAKKVRDRFGPRAVSGLTGVSFQDGLAEGCVIRPDREGWRLWLAPDAAGHEAWMGLRVGCELYARPCQAWWGALPTLLVALAKQAWEFQLYLGMVPSLRRQIRQQLTTSSPLTQLYDRCEASSWGEALAALCDAARQPASGPSAEAVAGDLATWREEGIVPEEAALGLVLYSQFGLSDALDEYTQRKWIYHPQQVAATLEGRLEDVVPVTVDIVPALECPQDCLACSNADWRKNRADPGWVNNTREQRMMPESVMTAMIEKIAAAGCKAVVFTGGGEPLVNRHTVAGAQHARRLGLEVGLYTNGMLMDESKIDALIGCRVTFIRYSVNAASPAAHALVGGYQENERKFSRVTEGLRCLAARNRAAGKPTTVGVSFIVNEWNLDELGKLARWLRELEDDPATRGGIDYLVIRPSLVHRGYRGGEQFKPELFEQARRRIAEEVEPALRGTGIKVIEIASRFASVHDTEKPYAKCTSTPWFGAAGPDGSLYLCAESYYGNRRILLGNLAEKTVPEIFHGEECRDVIDGIDFEFCPPVCKMQELNKYFDVLLRLKDTERAWVKNWLLTLGQTTEPPPHVNFL